MGKITAKQVIAYSKADPKKYSDGEGLYFCVRKQQNRAFCLPSSPEQMGKSCTGLLLSGLRKDNRKRNGNVISHQINLALLHHLCGPENEVWMKASFGTVTHYGTKN